MLLSQYKLFLPNFNTGEAKAPFFNFIQVYNLSQGGHSIGNKNGTYTHSVHDGYVDGFYMILRPSDNDNLCVTVV